MLSRRTLLTGSIGAAVTSGAVAAVGVEQRWLPGRPWLQERLGLNGPDGVVPEVTPGPVEDGWFLSEHRLGARTGWAVTRPPGTHRDLPLVVALHGLGMDHATVMGRELGLPWFLAAAARDEVAPVAVASVDGGTTYWHPRPNGEDAAAMVVDELLPVLAERGYRTDAVGLLGWSMGGYGALRLAAVLGPDQVPAIVAASPALWTDPDEASPAGFADDEEYERATVFGHQDELVGTAVRVDCGTGDPFCRDVEEYVAGFPEDAELVATFEPGGHDAGYWRRMLPDQLAFLASWSA